MLEQATTVEQQLGSCVIVRNSNIPLFLASSLDLGTPLPPSDPMEQRASRSTIVISVA